MGTFRDVVNNFKSQDDSENYLIRSKDFYPTLKGMTMQYMTTCRLTEDSLLMYRVFDTDKDVQSSYRKDNGVEKNKSF